MTSNVAALQATRPDTAGAETPLEGKLSARATGSSESTRATHKPSKAKPGRIKQFNIKYWKQYLAFLALAGPNLLLLLVFTYKPLFESFKFSTLQWNIGSPNARFVGAQNYVEFFTSEKSLQVLWNTLVFTIATVGGALVLGLALALLLNRKLVGRSIARTLTFAPYVLSGIAVGILWLYIFDPRYGLLKTVLGWFGVGSPDWLSLIHI